MGKRAETPQSITDLVIAAFDDNDRRRPLLAALEQRRQEWVDIHFTDAHVAVMRDDVKALSRALMTFDATTLPNFNRMSGVPVQSWSLIELAAACGSLRAFNALVERGGVLGEVGDAYKYAVEYQQLAVIDQLLELGSNPFDMLYRALEWNYHAVAHHLAPMVSFADQELATHLNLAGSLKPATPVRVVDQLIARGLELGARSTDVEVTDDLARAIGQHHDATWFGDLLDRGYPLDAQRVAEIIDAIPRDCQRDELALIELALARPFDRNQAISIHNEDYDEDPGCLFDLVAMKCSGAALERLIESGATPSGRAIRRAWPDGAAKAKLLGDNATRAPSRKMRQALAHATKRRTLLIDLEDFPHLEGQRDLDGIETCSRLVELTVNGLGLVDISALAQLPKLRALDLMSNQLSDLRPLAKLTKLTKLNIASNQVTTVDALATLTELETLYLAYNPIRDIAPLAGLTNLTYVSLRSTQVTDLSAIAKLPRLATLIVAGCQLAPSARSVLAALRRRVEIVGDRDESAPEKPKRRSRDHRPAAARH